MTMNRKSPTQQPSAGRWIAAVPWYTDGYHGLWFGPPRTFRLSPTR